MPSQLVRTLHDLLWATAELHQVLAVDVWPELWQVLLNHAQPDWVLPPHCTSSAQAQLAQLRNGLEDSGAPDESAGSSTAGAEAGCSNSGIPFQLQSMVLAYGDWYMSHVVRDVRGLGVLYAPQLRRFTCVRGPVEVIQQRTSLQELVALLQVSVRGALYATAHQSMFKSCHSETRTTAKLAERSGCCTDLAMWLHPSQCVCFSGLGSFWQQLPSAGSR